MKSFVRMIAMPLIAVLLFTTASSTGVFAKEKDTTSPITIVSDGVKVEIVKDNDDVRIVKTAESTSVFNKKTKVLTVTDEGKEPITIDLNDISTDINDNATIETINLSSFNPTSGENTFSNYEYDIDQSKSPDKWELRRPDPDEFNSTYYFRVDEKSSTKNGLYKFRDAVKSLNSAEWKLIAYTGLGGALSIFAIAVTAVSGGLGLTAFVAAIPVLGFALDAAIDVYEACDDANYWYWDVYY